MKLIVGLGNVGKKYQLTRHNLGFMVVDSLSGDESWSEKKSLSAYIQKTQIQSQSVMLAKPTTFMNLSGQAVQAIMNYYSIPTEDLLVIHDDIDLEFSNMKFQKSRGAGGHNGVSHIHEVLKTSDYYRLKMGVGKPRSEHEEHSPSTPSHVLSNFSTGELNQLEDFLTLAVKGVCHFVSEGGKDASQIYNQKSSD